MRSSKKSKRRSFRIEQLETRQLLAADVQNPGNPFDVTNDLLISARDALVIINRISRKTGNEDFFYDVSGDSAATPLDALRVINAMARQKPEVTLKLSHDTAHDQNGTAKDRKTFDLALKGKINFLKSTPTLFAGVGDKWIDVSQHLQSDGAFELSDQTMRQLLGDIGRGSRELRLSPDAKGERARALPITVLAAPPQPRLIEAKLDEDGNVVLDILGQTYDPDSKSSDVKVQIRQQPNSGTLTPKDNTYVYRPEPNFHGTDTVVYEVVDEEQSSSLTTLVITVDSINDLPQVTPVENKTIKIADGGFSIPFDVTDEDGEPLDIAGYASVPNPLFAIQQQYGLKYAGDYYENLTGLNEKWLFGANETSFFILPNGDLIQWQGSYAETGKRETLIARLDATIYLDPSLLWQASAETILPVIVFVDVPATTSNAKSSGSEGESTPTGQLLVKPPLGLVGNFTITVLADDGVTTQSQQFQVTIPEEYEDDDEQHELVTQLKSDAETLDYDTTDDFIQQLETSIPSFDGDPQSDLEALLQSLKSLYSDAQKNIASAGDFESSSLTAYDRQIAALKASKSAFAELQSQYEVAWQKYLASHPTGGLAANTNIPPIFIHGKTYADPIKVARGENITLDFQAVHPSGMRLYDFDLIGRSQNLFLTTDVQTGRFSWDTDPDDTGVYEFKVTANAGSTSQHQSSISFKIEVVNNEPGVEGVKISPAVISDTGQDPITLTAINPFHPRYDSVSVRYAQDANDNQQYDAGIDQIIGSGLSWTGLPKPIDPNTDSMTFFAIASVTTDQNYDAGLRADLFSEPVKVTVPVMHPPRPVITAIRSAGDEISVSSQPPTFTSSQVAFYGNDNSVVIDDTDGLGLQRYTNVNSLGIGTAVGERVKLPYSASVQQLVAKADQAGNVTIVFGAGNAGIDNPDDSAGSALWITKIGSDNQIKLQPTKLIGATEVTSGYVFTLDMNATGEGIVAAMPSYNNGQLQLISFSNGGLERGDVHSLNEVFTSFSIGQWHAAAIHASGDYILNFGNGDSAQGYQVRGNVDSAEPPTAVAVDYGAKRATINSQGWAVLLVGETLVLVDPSGNAVGTPLPLTSNFESRPVFSLRFVDDTQVELISERSSGMTRQRFSIAYQPGMEGSNLQLKSTTLEAGEPIELSYSLKNNSQVSLNGANVLFYLSRDNGLDAADRYVGNIESTDALASNAQLTVTGTVPLPADQDPYWRLGSESLQLIAFIPAAGQRFSIALPKVSVVAPTVTEITGPRVALPTYPSPTTPAKLPYIRTDVIAAQTSDTTYIKSDEFVELIGYQYLAGATRIAASAPTEVREQILALAGDMRLSLEQFELRRFLTASEKTESAATALSTQNAAIARANSTHSGTMKKAAEDRDAIVDPNQQIVDKALAGLTAKINAEKARVQSLIDRAEIDLRSLEGSAKQLLDEAIRLGKKLIPDVGKIRNLRSVAEDFKSDANAVKDTLATLRDQLESAAARVEADVNNAIALPREQIRWAKRAYEEASKIATRLRDDAIARAKSDYNKTVGTINSHATSAGKSIAAVVNEHFTGVIQKQIDIIQSIDSPEGLIQKVEADAKAIDEQNPFGSVEENIETAKVSAEVAQAVLDELNEKLAPIIDQFKQAGGKFSDWSKETGGKTSDWTKENGDEVAKWVKDNIDDVLDQEVIAYKGVTDFDMSLNLSNGAFYLDAKVAPGAGYDSRKLNALLESGNPSIPDIDPVDAIKKLFSARLVREDNYDELLKGLQKEFGAESVYFASRRFVDHFGGESALEVVAETFLFGGAAAAKDAIEDVGEHLRLELNDIIGWLSQKGEQQIEAVVPELIRAMLMGKEFRSPHIELRWTPVDYKYSLKPEPLLGKAVAALAGDEAILDDFVNKTRQKSRHVGFSIIWQIPDPGDPVDHFNNYLKNLEIGEFKGPSLTHDLVVKAIQDLVNEQLPEELKLSDNAVKVLDALGPIVQDIGTFEKLLAKTITDVLNFDTTDIEARIKQLKDLADSDFVLDFKGTPAANNLEEFLKKITFGNRRSAKITEFSFDLKTFTLRIRGEQCHQHSWGSIGDIVEGLQKRVNEQ